MVAHPNPDHVYQKSWMDVCDTFPIEAVWSNQFEFERQHKVEFYSYVNTIMFDI